MTSPMLIYLVSRILWEIVYPDWPWITKAILSLLFAVLSLLGEKE